MKTKILNIVLREAFDLGKLSAVPRAVLEMAERAQSEFKINIISNSETKKNHHYKGGINLIYLPGSLFSFFDNVLFFVKTDENQGVIHFFGSLSGGCVLSWKAKDYSNKIVLNLVNGGLSISDFRFLRFSDLILQPYNNIFHPSVLGIPIEVLFRRSLQNENISGIVVQSERLKKVINWMAPKARVYRIPYGVPQKYLLKKRIKNKKKTVLYFGHVYTVRGIDDMLKALNLLTLERTDFEIKFVVTPETNISFLESTLQKYPKLIAITSVVKKYISNLDKEIDKSALCVFMYRFAGEIPEYPLALLETMALSIPVITSRVGAIGELFNNISGNKCIVYPGDIEEIKNKINFFLTDQNGFSEIIRQNRKIVGNMTWDKCYNEIKRFY